MLKHLTLVALFGLVGAAWADDRPLGSGANCASGPVPKNAHRVPLHGNELYLYPVAPGASYTGCQRLGALSGDTIQFESTAKFERGRVLTFRTVDMHGRMTECTYRQGVVVERRLRGGADYRGERCPTEVELQNGLSEAPAR